MVDDPPETLAVRLLRAGMMDQQSVAATWETFLREQVTRLSGTERDQMLGQIICDLAMVGGDVLSHLPGAGEHLNRWETHIRHVGGGA